MPMPRLSLAIPAWNEAMLLPQLLASVAAAQASCRFGAGAIEVIVGDNGSSDATAAIAEAAGCRVATVEKRCIAAARNGAAAIASGEYLAFVDADSVLHPGVFDVVIDALDDPRWVGGASGVTMERWSAGIAISYALLVPMLWLTGLDSGVVFCRRADFEALGGYDESLAFAEDVDFLFRLRRLGKARGQRLRRLRGVKTVTSTRKFDRHGDWHWFTEVARIGWRWLRHGRAEAERFVRRYWYEDR